MTHEIGTEVSLTCDEQRIAWCNAANGTRHTAEVPLKCFSSAAILEWGGDGCERFVNTRTVHEAVGTGPLMRTNANERNGEPVFGRRDHMQGSKTPKCEYSRWKWVPQEPPGILHHPGDMWGACGRAYWSVMGCERRCEYTKIL